MSFKKANNIEDYISTSKITSPTRTLGSGYCGEAAKLTFEIRNCFKVNTQLVAKEKG